MEASRRVEISFKEDIDLSHQKGSCPAVARHQVDPSLLPSSSLIADNHSPEKTTFNLYFSFLRLQCLCLLCGTGKQRMSSLMRTPEPFLSDMQSILWIGGM